MEKKNVVVCFGLVWFFCSASPLLLLLRFLLWFRFFCRLGFRLPSLFSFLVSWRTGVPLVLKPDYRYPSGS